VGLLAKPPRITFRRIGMSVSLTNPRRLDSLEAVNLILNSYGQASVGRHNANAEATKARNHLGRTLTQVCAGPWRFSTFEDKALSRDVSGRIAISPDILSVAPSGADQGKRYVVKRSASTANLGYWLYDRDNETFVFDHDVTADVTYSVAFDDLPQVAAWYVAVLAASSYLGQNRPADPMMRNLEQARQLALIQLEQQESRDIGGTLRENNPHFARVRGRPTRSTA
jgi:hypothetical protein